VPWASRKVNQARVSARLARGCLVPWASRKVNQARAGARLARGCLVMALLLAQGCSSDSPAASSGDGGAQPGNCPTQRNVGAGDAPCDTGKGGPMRQIPLPDAGTMCIDKTEVTVGQYQVFLASGAAPELPATDPAQARCSAKKDHAPSCQKETCSGSTCDMPQTCVDQCDAKLYCQWAGKRLCGAISGALLAIADVNDPKKNQWMNACNSGGRDWPYGPDYDSTACNTSDQKPSACGGPAVTSSYPKCQAPAGPYDQVFDLSGNVSEWVDASKEGADWPEQSCVIVGGSYVHYWGDVSCSGGTLDWPCNAHHPEFGFRCCSK
jgi:formylglycine-generating enzyme